MAANVKCNAYCLFTTSLNSKRSAIKTDCVSEENTVCNNIRHSIVASIPACHAGDQGSIPCDGAYLLFLALHSSTQDIGSFGFLIKTKACPDHRLVFTKELLEYIKTILYLCD